jgi:hypothetical protein
MPRDKVYAAPAPLLLDDSCTRLALIQFIQIPSKDIPFPFPMARSVVHRASSRNVFCSQHSPVPSHATDTVVFPWCSPTHPSSLPSQVAKAQDSHPRTLSLWTGRLDLRCAVCWHLRRYDSYCDGEPESCREVSGLVSPRRFYLSFTKGFLVFMCRNFNSQRRFWLISQTDTEGRSIGLTSLYFKLAFVNNLPANFTIAGSAANRIFASWCPVSPAKIFVVWKFPLVHSTCFEITLACQDVAHAKGQL